ncbi:RhoGAP domain [Popillia japonica]|uniref:RhoGAP domain n=1 Tax=Popillia japonica TaxID=7064 RepID=A0AAW1KNB3_POPJA
MAGTLGQSKYGPPPSSTQYGTAAGTLTRRNRGSLDYSSDTEATVGPRTSYYYYSRNQSAIPHSTIPTLGRNNSLTSTDISTKFNSLPRDTRATTRLSMNKRFGERTVSLLQDETDGALSAPEMPSLRHRAIASTRSPSMRRMRQLLDLDSVRAGAPSPVPTPSGTLPRGHRQLDINPAEFLKYKIDKSGTTGGGTSISGLSIGPGGQLTSSMMSDEPVSGMLWVHLLAGRGLRASSSTSAATTPVTPSGAAPTIGSTGMRDLYCVLECDRVHKARTVVRTGDLVFDWDESFELDLVNNRELDLLIYSWDPQYRHKLCYKGSVHLPSLLKSGPLHQLALKIEPRGTLYLRLKHTDSQSLYKRRPLTNLTTTPVFGVDLDTVVNRELKTGGVPGGVATGLVSAGQQIPIIIKRCVEEIERRGLDIIGLYRLCGSATKKRILREAFERNSRSVDLTPDNVPDINVITGVLKDYLRELPEPLFTKCLYQMMVDALATALAPPLMLHSSIDSVLGGSAIKSSSTELDYTQPISVLKYLLQIWPIPKHHSGRRGRPPGPRGDSRSALPQGGVVVVQREPFRPLAAPFPPPPRSVALGPRGPVPQVQSQQILGPSSVSKGPYRPLSPRVGPQAAAGGLRPRQVIVSSPGWSPSSSSDSQSGSDSVKHCLPPSRVGSPAVRASPSPAAGIRTSPHHPQQPGYAPPRPSSACVIHPPSSPRLRPRQQPALPVIIPHHHRWPISDQPPSSDTHRQSLVFKVELLRLL